MAWLRFIAELLPGKRIDELLDECDQLCRILGKFVATAMGKSRPRATIRWPRSQLALPDFQFSIFHLGFDGFSVQKLRCAPPRPRLRGKKKLDDIRILCTFGVASGTSRP